MALIDEAIKEHLRLVKEIANKDTEIASLRNEAGIAKEAIDRYCPPELRDSAERWLRSKGI